MRRLVLLSLFAVAAAALLRPSGAAAEWSAPSLLSLDPVQQADEASQSAISADGDYVVFWASLGGIEGIYRRELSSGALQIVAYGEQLKTDDPSISADGRYVSFDAMAALDPTYDRNEASDVYVRDMDAPLPATIDGVCEPAPAPCPYELASALSGSDEGISYSSTQGSVAGGRIALSGDGREVAFVVQSPSNLVGGTVGSTPEGQVVVRYLDSKVTKLVSVRYEPVTDTWLEGEPVPARAAFAGTAALSADGSTVAWLGIDLPLQTRVLSDESNMTDSTSGDTEPLWRRIADGPGAPIRRVTGGGDPFAPGCPLGGATTSSPACVGPLDAGKLNGISMETALDQGPQLSADGRYVAFLADAPPLNSEFGDQAFPPTELYVADMAPGLTRSQALRTITQEAGDGEDRVDAPILDLAISGDGQHLAFVTARTAFPRSSPAYTSPPRGPLESAEVYSVDLDADTVERVTDGYEGGPSLAPGAGFGTGQGEASSPSLSADGSRLVFSSEAWNLVYGDANRPPGGQGGGDVFLASQSFTESIPPTSSLGPLPPVVHPLPRRRLSLTVRSRRDGSVVLFASVPGAGRLLARARGGVVVSSGLAAKRAGHPHTLADRQVASAKASSLVAGTLVMPMHLGRRYAALARRRHGLTAVVAVSFRGGGTKLRQTIQATFRIRRGGGPKAAGR